MTTDLSLLQTAIARLASVCDFAQDEDGRGFNKPDAGIGHRLAELPLDLWTAEEARDIYQRIRKYRGQLEGFGIDVAAIPEPAIPEDRPVDWRRRVGLIRAAAGKGATLSDRDRQHVDRELVEQARQAREAAELATRTVKLEGAYLRVAFAYRPELVAAVKAVPGRKRFDGASKTWLLELSSLNVPLFRRVLQEFRFDVDEAVDVVLEDKLRAGEGAPATLAPAKLVDLADDGSVLVVTFDYDAALVQDLKASAPAARWSKTEMRWHVALRWGSTEGLAGFAARRGFTVTPRALEAIQKVGAEHVGRLEESRLAAADFESLGITDKLPPELRPFPFQVAGVAYALKAKRVIIGDEMGLGKTIQALLTILAADAFPCAIVCPASLLYNWYKEARKWLRGRTISVLRSGAPGAYNADVLIINYDILVARRKRGEPAPKKAPGQKRAPVVLSTHAKGILEAKPQAIVFDEFHYCKNHAAQRTEAVKELAKGIPYRLGLTGTLFLNRPGEAIAPLGILGRLEDLGGFWHYARRYCGASSNGYGMDLSGAANLEELNTKLRSSCYIRREKADVLTELPAKTRQTIELDITNRAEYVKAEKDLRGWLAANAREDLAFLEKLETSLDARRRELRLEGLSEVEVDQAIALERDRALDAHEAARAGAATSKAAALVKIEALKQIAARGKLDAAIEWVESFVQEQKLILFARHIGIQKAIRDAAVKAGIRTVQILGEDAAEARQAAVDAFQTDDSVRLIVASLDAAGVGWTGTAASNVAFVELGWTPATHDQAEDRAHRIGQRDAVTAWYLVAKGTIEEDIADLIEAKREVVTAATVGTAASSGGSIVAGAMRRLAAGPRADAPAEAEEALIF